MQRLVLARPFQNYALHALDALVSAAGPAAG